MTFNIFQESTRKNILLSRLRDIGYLAEETRIDGTALIRIIAPSGRVWLTGKNMAYPMNSHMIHQVANNKRMSYEIASGAGIEVPESLYSVTDSYSKVEAEELLKKYGRLIAKPLDSYKSRGVTVGITTHEVLDAAVQYALQESTVAIIQQQVHGEEYRFTVLDGAVVSVLRRERPQVVGDGISTVRDLVEAENSSRREIATNNIVTYPQWTPDLLGDVIESDEVLADGEARILSSASLVSGGASVYELMDEVDRSYIELAERFVHQIGAGFVAVDMFIVDHTEPAKAGGYWFNECNISPSLKMYFTPRNADSSHVVDRVVELTDQLLI